MLPPGDLACQPRKIRKVCGQKVSILREKLFAYWICYALLGQPSAWGAESGAIVEWPPLHPGLQVNG